MDLRSAIHPLHLIVAALKKAGYGVKTLQEYH